MTEPSLTDLQKRLVIAALRQEGRLILWVLKNGRVVIPGFPQEDATDGVRALEGAGYLALDEEERKHARGSALGTYGWHVFHLTEAGRRAAQGAIGRRAG